MVYTIITLILLIVFFIFAFRLLKSIKQLKNRYGKASQTSSHHEDVLLGEKFQAGNVNFVYENKGESNSVIDKYMISYENKTPFLICHVIKPLTDVRVLEISVYNEKHELQRTYYIKNTETFEQKPFLELQDQPDYVNIRIHESDEAIEAVSDFYALRAKAYRSKAKYESIALFFLLAPVSYGLLYLVAGSRTNSYMTMGTLALGFALIAVTILLNYVLIALFIALKSRNRGELSE